MCWKIPFFLLFVFHACLCIGVDTVPTAASSSSIVQNQRLEKIGAVQLKLSNGMTICLKPTESETDEFVFKVVALGGYGGLDQADFFSGKLADRIAWESGMGGMTTDQLSVFLYENSMEFVPDISPFVRTIEGEGREESIEAFFQCLNMVFTQQQFTKNGFKAAKILTKDIINKLRNDSDHVYEEAFLRVNSQNSRLLQSWAQEDLDQVNFEKSKSFFRKSFSNPADFICVMAGKFDVKQVIPLIEKYLGPLKKTETDPLFKKTFSVPFPPGITETTIKLPPQSNCLTHLTFPLQIAIDDQNISEIAFMCQIIEMRLRHAITDKMNLSYGVDVSYEFPLYPYLNNPWISIRYRCEDKIVSSLKDIAILELKRLQTSGATAEEVAAIKKLEKGSQEFWLKDDFYLVSMLSNYYLWGWNPENIDYQNTSIYSLNIQTVNSILKRAISLSNYSIVSAIGGKL